MAYSTDSAPATQARFQETRWSIVLAAGRTDTPETAPALESLCRAYWPPLYAFIRRRGHPPEEARDLTQEFFVRLFERNEWVGLSPDKGRFRSFLLTALKNFLANDWHRKQCQRRGGGQTPISLDAQPVEWRYRAELVATSTPETVFERHWAFTVLDEVMHRLQREYALKGKSDLFDLLKCNLCGEQPATPRALLAETRGISPGAVDVALHRMRRRYGKLLRDEIAHTVGHPRDVDEEIRHLKEVLGGH